VFGGGEDDCYDCLTALQERRRNLKQAVWFHIADGLLNQRWCDSQDPSNNSTDLVKLHNGNLV
jgi:hypothetical protein